MSTELILPTSPADLKKLNGAFEEAALCLQRMDDQRLQLKAIFDQVKDDFQIAPKYSRKLAKVFYKNNFMEVQAEQEEFQSLYEAVAKQD